MSVIVSIEDIGSCQRKVKVEVPSQAVEAETERIAKEFGRRAKIPGFRKGKVPAALVKQRFNEDIEREVVERLLPRYWRQAEAEGSLSPLLPPELGEVDIQEGSDLTFTAIVDLRPEIELGNLADFDLPDPAVEPTEDEVEEALEDLRRSVAEWKDTDRSAARGDLVVAEVRQLEPGDAGAQGRSTTFEIGDPRIWEELTAAVTGLSAGQEARFERQALAEGEVEKKSYSVAVERVRERDLPPLEDSLAVKVGKFESLAALRTEILAQLRAGKQRERYRLRETALLDQLCERHPIELPKRVVGHEVERLLSDYAAGLADQGVDLDRAEIDWRRLADEVRPRAEKNVRARLILDSVGEEQGVELRDEELEGALAKMAREQRTSSGALRRDLDRAGKLGALREQLLREKTIRSLLGESSEPDRSESDPGSG
jgi:trigger factor